MAYQILESTERPIADDLLEIGRIYEIYSALRERWVRYFRATSEATRNLAASIEGNEGPLSTPRELIRHTTIFTASLSPELGTEIRRLQGSDEWEVKDIYDRLSVLDVRPLSLPEEKGVFLLFAKAVEDSEADQDTQPTETENEPA